MPVMGIMPGMRIAVGTSRRSRVGVFSPSRLEAAAARQLLLPPLVCPSARAHEIGGARDDVDLELTAP
jgi:hypothetical protein